MADFVAPVADFDVAAFLAGADVFFVAVTPFGFVATFDFFAVEGGGGTDFFAAFLAAGGGGGGVFFAAFLAAGGGGGGDFFAAFFGADFLGVCLVAASFSAESVKALLNAVPKPINVSSIEASAEFSSGNDASSSGGV